MKKLLSIFVAAVLCLQVQGQSSATNTATTIEISNSSCFFNSGNYEIEYGFYDLEGNSYGPYTGIPATLTVTGVGSFTISAPTADFPDGDAPHYVNLWGVNPYVGTAGPYGTTSYIKFYQSGVYQGRIDIAFEQIICTGALPVTLSSFSGSISGCTVTLLWTTVSESNSSHFVIERNFYGGSTTAMKVGSVPAAGESYSTLNYGFIDYYPASGTNYYRLRMVDLDGSIKYSNTVVVSATGCTTAPPVNDCSGISITGSETICNYGNTFNLSAEPNYSTITWSVTPTSVANWGGHTTTKAWLKKVGNGIATLQANLSNCSSGGGVITKNITVGTPTVSITKDTLHKDAASTDYRLSATNIPGTTNANYTWTKNGVFYSNSRVVWPEVPPGTCETYEVTVTLPCGGTVSRSTTVCFVQPPRTRDRVMIVDPVPASSVVNIRVKSLHGALKPAGVYKIELLDLYGHVYRQKKISRLDIRQQLDVTNVPNGLYVLKVSNGIEVYTQEIKILH